MDVLRFSRGDWHTNVRYTEQVQRFNSSKVQRCRGAEAVQKRCRAVSEHVQRCSGAEAEERFRSAAVMQSSRCKAYAEVLEQRIRGAEVQRSTHIKVLRC